MTWISVSGPWYHTEEDIVFRDKSGIPPASDLVTDPCVPHGNLAGARVETATLLRAIQMKTARVRLIRPCAPAVVVVTTGTLTRTVAIVVRSIIAIRTNV